MVRKNYTTFKRISILCLAICGMLGWDLYTPSPPADSPHTPNAVVPPIQAQYMLANTGKKLSFHFPEALKPYFTPLSILCIVIIGIVVIPMLWFRSQDHNYGTIQVFQAHTPLQPPNANYAAENSKQSQVTTPVHSSNTKTNQKDQQRSIAIDQQATAMLISKTTHMIQATSPFPAVTFSDMLMFNTLIASTNRLPAAADPSSILPRKKISSDLQSDWDTFAHRQKSITFDMKYMYEHYEALRRRFFSQNIRNLLLLDEIVAVFPKVTKITCAYVDCIGWTPTKQYIYAPDTVNSAFIINMQHMLKRLGSNTKLQEIIIKTSQYTIEYYLDGPPIDTSGWYIAIALTKTVYSDFLSKISFMIQSKRPLAPVTFWDMLVFSTLSSSTKPLQADTQYAWDTFRYSQKSISFNMQDIYKHYKALRPLFFSSKGTNLLWLEQIVAAFPEVTKITCTYANCIGWTPTKEYTYAPDTISSAFIMDMKYMLKTLGSKTRLQTIIIKTDQHKIKYHFNGQPLHTLGWYIKKANRTVALTKTPYKDFLTKISFMIQGKAPSYEATPFDASIFNRLINRSKHIPAATQRVWDKFRPKRLRITLDIEYMYRYYAAFIHLLFSAQHTNLLRFDKISKLFPNVTHITCEYTDCTEWDEDIREYDYSANVIGARFIEGLKNCLRNIDQQSKLSNITITTWKNEIKINCNAYAAQFKKLGWKIKNEKPKYVHRKIDQLILIKDRDKKKRFARAKHLKPHKAKRKRHQHTFQFIRYADINPLSFLPFPSSYK